MKCCETFCVWWIRKRLARVMVLVSAGVAVFLVLVSMPVPVEASSPVQEKADQLAYELRSAGSVSETMEVITSILELFDFPVHEYAGVIRITESGPEVASGLNPEEVEMIATAFRDGTLIPLDSLVQQWLHFGVRFTALGDREANGAVVEEALRNLRRKAELEPDNEDFLLIRLVDALGRRAEKPFNLLGPPDRSCQEAHRRVWGTSSRMTTAQIRKSLLEEDLEREIEASEERGDEQMAEMMGALLSNEEALEGLVEGDMTAIMKMAYESENPDKSWEEFQAEIGEMMEQGLSQAQLQGENGTSDMVSEMGMAGVPEAEALESMQFMGVWSMDSLTDADESLSTALKRARKWRDAVRNELELLREKFKQEMPAVQKALQEETDADDAIDLARKEAMMLWEIGMREAELDRLQEYVEELEELVKRREEQEQQEQQARSVVFYKPPEPTSCLHLDPVQVLLVQLDVFGLTANEPGFGKRR